LKAKETANMTRTKPVLIAAFSMGVSLCGVVPTYAQNPAATSNDTPGKPTPVTQQLAMGLRRPHVSLALIPLGLYEAQVKVTPEQKQIIRDVQATMKREIKNLLPNPENLPDVPKPRGKRTFPNVWEKIGEREAEASGRINAVLKRDQREIAQKLAQTVWVCLRLDIPPETLDSLSLSDSQLTQLTNITQIFMLEKDVEFEQATVNNDHEALRRIAANRKQTAQEQARAVLNDAQRTTITEWRKANASKAALNRSEQ
jgi:hypothetical protein